MTKTAAKQTPSSSDQAKDAALCAALEVQRTFLRGVAYRITGSLADAEDVVQESFVRTLQSPPPLADAPLRPWLLRVATNLAIDVLRRRKRRAYVGPWLPTPIADTPLDTESRESATSRYDARESVTFAFLLALEALTPKQRAVLILRDVLDLDVRETAAVLQLSEANVKVLHLRARDRLVSYDAARTDTSDAARSQVQAVLQQLLAALAQADVAQVAALLSQDVSLLTDGGGKYLAARKPVLGRSAVALFLVKVTRENDPAQIELSLPNLCGLPAIHVRNHAARPNVAPRSVLGISLDAEGKIRCLYSVLIDDKLGFVSG